MAETLTIDPTPPAEIAGEAEGVQLTAEEQDSLQVGEQIQGQQVQLLAGKYENAQELEKAYVELQKKLGEKSDTDTEETESEAETVDEESTEKPKSLSEAGELISSANDEYYENDGKLSPETLEKFNSMSSQDLVQAYLEVQGDLQRSDQAIADISDAAINEVKNSAGGEQAYQEIINWASDNLDQDSINAFDSIINTGSVDAIKLAVNGLKSRWENAVGYEGEMVTGKAPTSTKDVYRSQAELVRAMSDPRYDNDPAYRQDVMQKLEQSDNLQF